MVTKQQAILYAKFREALIKVSECEYTHQEYNSFVEDPIQTSYWKGRRDAILNIINTLENRHMSLENAIDRFCPAPLKKKLSWNRVMWEVNQVQRARERGEEIYFA